jgi:hypothetical protein
MCDYQLLHLIPRCVTGIGRIQANLRERSSLLSKYCKVIIGWTDL